MFLTGVWRGFVYGDNKDMENDNSHRQTDDHFLRRPLCSQKRESFVLSHSKRIFPLYFVTSEAVQKLYIFPPLCMLCFAQYVVSTLKHCPTALKSHSAIVCDIWTRLSQAARANYNNLGLCLEHLKGAVTYLTALPAEIPAVVSVQGNGAYCFSLHFRWAQCVCLLRQARTQDFRGRRLRQGRLSALRRHSHAQVTGGFLGSGDGPLYDEHDDD